MSDKYLMDKCIECPHFFKKKSPVKQLILGACTISCREVVLESEPGKPTKPKWCEREPCGENIHFDDPYEGTTFDCELIKGHEGKHRDSGESWNSGWIKTNETKGKKYTLEWEDE